MGIPLTWSGFQSLECCNCGVGFAMEIGLYQRRQQDHGSFWCPNGHSQHFIGTTPDEKKIAELQRERDQLKYERDSARTSQKWAEDRAKSANIAAGMARAAKRRLEVRVARGVCPCCHRTFKQLAAHMKAKHPETVK